MSNDTPEPEIEITPEMIEAGTRSFRLADVHVMSINEDERIVVANIFTAMEKARQSVFA
jgi:hypothetical protein